MSVATAGSPRDRQGDCSSPGARPSPRPCAGRHRRGHRLPDPALRHGDAVRRQADRQRGAGLRVHRGGERARPVRDRQARLGRGGARVLRLERRRLDVRHGGADRDAGAAHAHGGHGGESRAGRPRRLRLRAQRRARACATWAGCSLGGHRPGGARHRPDRLPGGRGPADLPALRHRGGRRLPHPLGGAGEGPHPGTGGPLPAPVQPGRQTAPPGQPHHRRPAGQRGLGDGDPQAERRGHAPGARRDRGGLRRLPDGSSGGGATTPSSRST